MFTFFAVAGTILAIKSNLSQGGNMISMTSIIGTQLADKGKERNESTKNELQKMEGILNQEFLNDFFQENALLEESGFLDEDKKTLF